MNELTARKVLLLHAFESVHPRSQSWTETDSAKASSQAIKNSSTKQNFNKFVVNRAKFAFSQLIQRKPHLAEWLSKGIWSTGLVALVLLAGIIVGAIVFKNVDIDFTLKFGGVYTIDIIPYSFIPIVSWNIMVYVLLLVSYTKSKLSGHTTPNFLIKYLLGTLKIGLRPSKESADSQIVDMFTRQWLSCSSTLTASRAKALLHGLSASLVLGMIIGLYILGAPKGLYLAGDSTWWGEPKVMHKIHTTLFWPASTLSNIPLLSLSEVAEIKVGTKVSAANWIHLYSLTLILIVVLPRIILMLWELLRSNSLSKIIVFSQDGDYFSYLREVWRINTASEYLASFMTKLAIDSEVVTANNMWEKLKSKVKMSTASHQQAKDKLAVRREIETKAVKQLLFSIYEREVHDQNPSSTALAVKQKQIFSCSCWKFFKSKIPRTNFAIDKSQPQETWTGDELNQFLVKAVMNYLSLIRFQLGGINDEVFQGSELLQSSLIPDLEKVWKLRSSHGEITKDLEHSISSSLEPIISKTLNSILIDHIKVSSNQ